MQLDQSTKAKILIVDDHAIIRSGISMLINRETDIYACCEAEHIEQAVEANRLCAHDLAIVDMSLAGASGMELIRRFKFEFPDIKILVLSMHDESIYAEAVLRTGAHGYLMKQAATSTLLQALRQILEGGLYLSEQMQARMLNKMMGKSDDTSHVGELTASELQVLHLIGMGIGTNAIAKQLSRSVKTIESHKGNIKKKLNLESANQLALFAINLVSSGTTGPN
jgi:DNA-binding NarL/FixJ family response regulator